jgi:hypothetical protein
MYWNNVFGQNRLKPGLMRELQPKPDQDVKRSGRIDPAGPVGKSVVQLERLEQWG